MSTNAPCPKCGHAEATPVRFTWWGGLIGPRLFKQVECRACGTGYNGRTGRRNTLGIALYLIVVALVFGAIGFALVR